MAVVTSLLDQVLNTIADGLAARPALAKVQIATGPLGGDSLTESIQFFTGNDSQAHATTARRRESTMVIDGAIWVTRGDKDEAAIRRCRARAFALLAEVETYLRVNTDLGTLVRECGITSIDLDQGINPDGRWCQIDFTITETARLNS